MTDATGIQVDPPPPEKKPLPDGYNPPSDMLRRRAALLREEAADLDRIADAIDGMSLEPWSAQDRAIRALVLGSRPQGAMTTGRHIL